MQVESEAEGRKILEEQLAHLDEAYQALLDRGIAQVKGTNSAHDLAIDPEDSYLEVVPGKGLRVHCRTRSADLTAQFSATTQVYFSEPLEVSADLSTDVVSAQYVSMRLAIPPESGLDRVALWAWAWLHDAEYQGRRSFMLWPAAIHAVHVLREPFQMPPTSIRRPLVVRVNMIGPAGDAQEPESARAVQE